MTSASPIAAAALALLVACSGPSSAAPPSASPPQTASAGPTTAEPEGATRSPEPTGHAAGDLLEGTLGYDGIEGGCSYVEADGTRHEVVYPDGYAIDRSSGDLLGPAGEVVVPLGGEIRLRGTVNEELVSICMIGPIFEAVEVTAP